MTAAEITALTTATAAAIVSVLRELRLGRRRRRRTAELEREAGRADEEPEGASDDGDHGA